MSELGGVRESAARLFFFYLLEPHGARILGKYSAQKREHRQDVLAEIVDMTLIATNDILDPRYPYAFVSCMHRMRGQLYKPIQNMDFIPQYVHYLVGVVNPTAEELRQAHQYGISETLRQARMDTRNLFKVAP